MLVQDTVTKPKSQSFNISLMAGEIISIAPRDPSSDDADPLKPELGYVLNSIKDKDGKTTGYAILPIIPLTSDDAGHKKELELLRDYRGRVSDRLKPDESSPKHFRAVLEINEVYTEDYKLTPIARIQSVAVHTKIQADLVNSLQKSGRDPAATIATSRDVPKTKTAACYLDIELSHAVTAEYISQDIADILSKYGNVKRLGTAAAIANDKNPDKLLQIYDKARPHQTMSFEDFANDIKKGMHAFTQSMSAPASEAALQEKIPGATLRHDTKEKISFRFKERCHDLSLEDAFNQKYIWNEETYNVFKSAGFKTLRQAFNTLEKHGIDSVRSHINKKNAEGFTFAEIAEDLREAQAAFDQTMANPEDFESFEWNVQLNYPVQAIK